MKKSFYLAAVLFLTGCVESPSKTEISLENPEQEEVFEQQTENIDEESEIVVDVENTTITEDEALEQYRRESLELSFEKATHYNLSDTLIADFNGDGVLDKAYYKNDGKTSGIIIIHGGLNEEVQIGFGNDLIGISNFDWLDSWGVVEDRETEEVIILDDGGLKTVPIQLENPAIAILADEVGGGLITFLNGEYVYIHQTC